MKISQEAKYEAMKLDEWKGGKCASLRTDQITVQ